MSYSVLISVLMTDIFLCNNVTLGAKAHHLHRSPGKLRLKCSQKRLFYCQSLKMLFNW